MPEPSQLFTITSKSLQPRQRTWLLTGVSEVFRQEVTRWIRTRRWITYLIIFLLVAALLPVLLGIYTRLLPLLPTASPTPTKVVATAKPSPTKTVTPQPSPTQTFENSPLPGDTRTQVTPNRPQNALASATINLPATREARREISTMMGTNMVTMDAWSTRVVTLTGVARENAAHKTATAGGATLTRTPVPTRAPNAAGQTTATPAPTVPETPAGQMRRLFNQLFVQLVAMGAIFSVRSDLTRRVSDSLTFRLGLPVTGSAVIFGRWAAGVVFISVVGVGIPSAILALGAELVDTTFSTTWLMIATVLLVLHTMIYQALTLALGSFLKPNLAAGAAIGILLAGAALDTTPVLFLRRYFAWQLRLEAASAIINWTTIAISVAWLVFFLLIALVASRRQPR